MEGKEIVRQWELLKQKDIPSSFRFPQEEKGTAKEQLEETWNVAEPAE